MPNIVLYVVNIMTYCKDLFKMDLIFLHTNKNGGPTEEFSKK